MQHLFFSRPIHLLTRVAPLLAALVFAPLVGWGQSTTIVISQVFGAGGNNTTSSYRNDYVELFNKSASTVSLNGYTLQYASASGAFSVIVTFTSLQSIAAGKYFLVQLASGGNATPPTIPTADASGAQNISGTDGKLTLANNSTVVTSASDANVIDFVGYGTANAREGASSSNNAPAPSNTTAILRAGSGCTDTNVNSADFAAGAANPRNSSTAANTCVSNTITAPAVASGLPACVTAATGGALGNITFTSAGAGFTGSVTYTAQLSNASGSFASPVTLGSVTNSAGPGAYTITGATVPANTASGTAYAVRVVTTSPAVTGSSLTAQTIARYTVAVTPAGAQTIPVGGGGGALLTAAPAGSGTATVSWRYATMSGGATTAVASAATGTTYTPTGTDFPGAGTYFLVARSVTTGTACGTTQTVESNEVTINVSAAPVITLGGTLPLAAFNALAGAVSAAQTYTVSGSNLSGTTGITVTPPANYEIAFGAVPGTYFTTAQTIAQTSANTVATTTVNVRLTNTAATNTGLFVTNASTPATQQDVAVAGTVVAEPTIAPTVSAGTPGTTTVTLTIGGGNGTKRLVIVRPAANGALTPTDQITYAANLAYGTVATNSTTGTNNFVIVAGTATTANVTGLAPGVAYVADVYAYNEGTVAGFENYFTTSGTPATFTTTTGPCVTGGDFDSGVFPTGWDRSSVAAISFNSSNAANGTASGGSMGAANTSWITTNVATNPSQVSFYLGVTTNVNARVMAVQVSTAAQTGPFTTVKTFAHNASGDVILADGTYNQYTVDLSLYNSSSTVWIRFERTTGSSTSAFRLDEIQVTCGPLTANTTVGTVSPTSNCVAGAGANITIPFTVTNGPFNSGNVLTAQLSDASGSFTTPANNTALATVSTTSNTVSGTLVATIPNTVAAGTGYRVRLLGTDPVATGTANAVGNALTVVQPPAVTTVTLTGTTTHSFCATTGTVSTQGAIGRTIGTLVPGVTYSTAWKRGPVGGGGPYNTTVSTATSYTPAANNFGNVAGTYSLIAEVTADCGNVVSTSSPATITLLPNTPIAGVRQGSTDYASGGTAYPFGSVAWGAPSGAITFTLRNTGCAALTLDLVTNPLTTTGDYSVTQPLSSSIAAGGSTTFTVTFAPTGLGTRTGTVSIPSNDPAAPYVLNLTGTGTPSNLSDVITSTAPGFTYNTTGIDYASKQGMTVFANADNALNEVVYRLTVRDGGGTTDADNLPTILDGLTINVTQGGVTGAASIGAATLFTTSNGVAGQALVNTGAGTLTFSGLVNYQTTTLGLGNANRVSTLTDGGAFDLILRVTFTTTATDGQQLRFSVANASAVAGGSNTSSTFITTGTAVSTNAAGANVINVIATKLVYSPAVVTTGVVNADFGVTVVAQDVNNNADTDFKNLAGVISVPSVTLTRGAGTGTFSSVLNPTLTRTLTGGTAAWTDVRYDVVENGVGLLTTNTGGLANASATINFIAFNGHLWVGASGGSWYVASNWSKNTVPTATDDVRLDNSSVSGSYSVSIATPNSAGGTALARTLQVGYGGNTNTITLNISGGGGSVDDNLRVGPASGGTALLIADGGVVDNSTNASGGGNAGVDFASTADTWEMTGTGRYRHSQNAGDAYPGLGSNKAVFAATSTFEVANSASSWHGTGGGLARIKNYGNLTITNPTSFAFGTALNSVDSLIVKGNLALSGSTAIVSVSNDETSQIRLRVKGNLTTTNPALVVSNDGPSPVNSLIVEGNVTTTVGGLIRGTVNQTGAQSRTIVGGSFSALYEANQTADELLFTTIRSTGGNTAPATLTLATNSRLRFLKIYKEVVLGANVANPSGQGSITATVESGGTLDFGGATVRTVGGNGSFELKDGGTLKINSPDGIIKAAGATTGNVQTAGVHTFPNGTALLPTTYWYTGTTAQVTGTGLIPTNGVKNIICDNPTRLTLTDPLASELTGAEIRIQTPGRLEIKQGTLIETPTAEITSTGNLTMSGGTYRMVKGVASGNPTTNLPQLSGTYTITGGALELAGTGNQSLTARNVYNKLRFKNAGVKTLTSGIGILPDSVVIGGAAILDLTRTSASTDTATVGLAGTGGLRMSGTSRLITRLVTGPAPGVEGEYTLTGGTIQFTGSSPTNTQTIRSNNVIDPDRTYFNIEVTGSNVGASSGNFAIGTGGTMAVKAPSMAFPLGGSFSMTDQAITGAGSFVVETGATFKYGATQGITTFATGGTGTSAGNIRVSGARTFSTGGNYVVQGAGNAATGDGLPATVASLTVNKSSASNVLTLTSPLTATTALMLTSGILSIGNNDVTMAPGATLTGGSASSYIRTDPSPTATGTLKRTVVGSSATPVVFPVGTSTYTPATLSQPTGGTTDVFSVRVFNGVFKGGTTGTASTDHVVNRTWMIEEAASGPGSNSNATLTLQWNAADELPLFTRSECRIGHYLAGIGYDRASPTTGPYGIAAGSDPFTRFRTNITSFSPFAVGDAGGVLPVELTAFTATAKPGVGVQLNWATASEKNNDRFEVQRSQSADSKGFVTITTVRGQGTTSEAHAYDYLDRQAPQGLVYYRIRQVDRDGAESFSVIESVKVSDGRNDREVTLFPVPATTELSVSHGPLAPGARLTVYDALGRPVLTATPAEAATTDRLNVAPLPAGVYRLVLTDGTGQRLTKSFVKTR